MINDPIVEEVHQTRQRIFTEAGGDLESLIEWLKATDQVDQTRLVTFQQIQERANQSVREQSSEGK